MDFLELSRKFQVVKNEVKQTHVSPKIWPALLPLHHTLQNRYASKKL